MYIEILETLQLNNRQNLPWDTVIMRIQRNIEQKKPQVWPMLRKFLDDVHSRRGMLYNKDILLLIFFFFLKDRGYLIFILKIF